MVAAEVQHGQVDETADLRIAHAGNLALRAVQLQLTGNRTVDPAVGRPRVGARQCAAEVAVRHRLRESDQDRHEFGRTSRHHSVHGNQPRGRLPVRRRNGGDHGIRVKVGVFQKFIDPCRSRRYDRQTVRPAVLGKIEIHFIQIAGIDDPVRRSGFFGSFQFFIGERTGEGGDDLRPEDPAGVFQQFPAGMGGKCAGIFCHTRNRDSGNQGRPFRLFGESRSRDHHGRQTAVFRGDAGAHFLRRAQSASAVAGNDGIDLQPFQVLHEFVFLPPDHARTGPRSRRTDLAQDIYLRIRIVLQDQSSDFRMRYRCHETAAHDGDVFPVQGGQPRRLFDLFDGIFTDRRKHSAFLSVITASRQFAHAGVIAIIRGHGGNAEENDRGQKRKLRFTHFLPPDDPVLKNAEIPPNLQGNLNFFHQIHNIGN